MSIPGRVVFFAREGISRRRKSSQNYDRRARAKNIYLVALDEGLEGMFLGLLSLRK